MTCKHCGAQMEEDATFCPACQAEDQTADVETVRAESEEEASPETETEQTAAPETEAEVGEIEADDPGTETSVTDSEYPDSGHAEAPLDGFSDDETPVRKKGFMPFVISLVVIVALGIGAFFIFFSGGGEEAAIMRAFNAFNTAMQSGDIEAMQSCYVENEHESGEIPIFGQAEQIKEGLDMGYYGDLEIDFTSDQTMLQSFVKALGLTFDLHKEYITVDASGETAVLDVVQTLFFEGQTQRGIFSFNMVKIDGRWYLTKGTSEAQ